MFPTRTLCRGGRLCPPMQTALVLQKFAANPLRHFLRKYHLPLPRGARQEEALVRSAPVRIQLNAISPEPLKSRRTAAFVVKGFYHGIQQHAPAAYRHHHGRQRTLGKKARAAAQNGPRGRRGDVPPHRDLLQESRCRVSDSLRVFHGKLETFGRRGAGDHGAV